MACIFLKKVSQNKNMMRKEAYKINDLARELDRDTSTILRWEKQGIIPSAKRDSHGWRYYSNEDFQNIIQKVKESQNANKRLAGVLAACIIAINLIAFFTISKSALGNANMNANLNIQQGSLTVYASSTLASFSNVTYSFSAQTSTLTDMGTGNGGGGVGVADLRGTTGSWTFNISCADSPSDCMWKGATEKDRFSMHRGAAATSDASTSGIICFNLANNRCVSSAGQACSYVTTQTAYSCINSSKTDVQIANSAGGGVGEYWFAEQDWAQAVPGRASASVYTTTLIWDLVRNNDSTQL